MALERDCTRCDTLDIHIGMVSIGVNASRDMVVTLKSILAHRSAALHIHVLVDSASNSALSTLFTSWPLECVQVSLHMLANHTAEIAWVRTSHASGMYGLSKLTYERVLPHVPRIIAVDTDLVFTRDVAELWALFDSFTETQMIGAVPQQSDWYSGSRVKAEWRWPAVDRGINSGVMLLHLDRMRYTRWRHTWTALARAQLSGGSTLAPLADQDVFNLAMTRKPDAFAVLPCVWNVQMHEYSGPYPCSDARGAAVIHWNSPLRLKAPHALTRLATSTQRRYSSMDGYSLSAAPMSCVDPMTASKNNNNVDDADLCTRLRAVGKRTYRVHADYYRPTAQKRLFSCYLIGAGTEAAMDHLRRNNLSFILARTSLLAQNRFFKLIETQRVAIDDSIHWPDSPVAVCDDVTDTLGHSRDIDVTLCTQLSMDRLSALPRMLSQWHGPVSVAVLVKDADLPRLDAFIFSHADVFASHDGLRLHCVFETDEVYPVNYLRNVALQFATTHFVFNVDIDFLISPNAHELIKRRVSTQPNLQSDKIALVVPAFETDMYNPVLPASKAALQDMQLGHKIRQFRKQEWEKGHAATDYSNWFRASMAYPVSWVEGYEPYLVVLASSARQAKVKQLTSFIDNKTDLILGLSALAGTRSRSRSSCMRRAFGSMWCQTCSSCTHPTRQARP